MLNAVLHKDMEYLISQLKTVNTDLILVSLFLWAMNPESVVIFFKPSVNK